MGRTIIGKKLKKNRLTLADKGYWPYNYAMPAALYKKVKEEHEKTGASFLFILNDALKKRYGK